MRSPTTYQSRPTFVEAVRWFGSFVDDVAELAPGKVRIVNGELELLAGVDGVQGWVPVPVGHWVVRQPGDPSDVWPVEDIYFQRKYDLPAAKACEL